MYRYSKRGVALLITILSIISITAVIGFNLKQVNETSKIITDEKMMYQSIIIIEDIIEVLNNSPEIISISKAETNEEFFNFLNQSNSIVIKNEGISINIKFSSARSKINFNSLDIENIDIFKDYMFSRNVSDQYTDFLLNITNINNNLKEGSLTSSKHLKDINNIYIKTYNENSFNNINFNNLFTYSEDSNRSIDLNYVTKEVWEFLTGATADRAEYLKNNAGLYQDFNSLYLSDEEMKRIKRFKTSFYEPILLVEVKIEQNNKKFYVSFEYDILNKKGSNFNYDI